MVKSKTKERQKIGKIKDKRKKKSKEQNKSRLKHEKANKRGP